MEPVAARQNGSRQQDEVHLRDVWNLLLRNRWLIFLVVVLVVGSAGALTFMAVPVYESTASIRIDEDPSNVPVLDILETISTGSQVETEMEVLRSRTLAEDVVDSLALQVVLAGPRGVARGEVVERIHVETWAPPGLYRLTREGDVFTGVEESTEADVDSFTIGQPSVLPGVTFMLTPEAAEHAELRVRVQSFEDAVKRLSEAVTVARPNREASVVVVRYEASDTQLVHQVANALALMFITQRRDIQKTGARSTVRFLREQIDTIRGQLAGAEDDLQAFREGEQVVSLQAEATAQVSQLAQLQTDRNQIDAERDALQALLDEIEAEPRSLDRDDPSPFRRLIAFPSLLRNPASSELLRSLNEAEQPLAELLTRRTRDDPDVVAVVTRVRELETQLRSLAVTYLTGLTNQVASLDRTLIRFGSELERIPAKELQSARLERRANILNDIYTLLETRLKEAEIAQAVEDASVRVVDSAVLPMTPIKPRTRLTLILSVVLGVMLGVTAAYVRDYVDDTVHTREDVQHSTRGSPVLGLIPRIREFSKTNGRQASRSSARATADGVEHLGARLVTGRDPKNPVSEAYRGLRTNISFASPDKPPIVIVFTSPLPQDGKSTSASNLAITLAQQGRRVILIDADLRRGVLHEVFGTPREPGLANLLAGHVPMNEVVREVDLGESGRLTFIPTGSLPPNPAELLGSERMKQLLDKLSGVYGSVILDSAPLNVVTDAAVLGTNADGVILVARAGATEKGALRYAVEQLDRVRAPILGAVLNDIDFKRDRHYSSDYGRYGYYYQYYYGSQKT